MAEKAKKGRAPFKSIWPGILGISVEVLMAIAAILAGFLVCLFWWGMTR